MFACVEYLRATSDWQVATCNSDCNARVLEAYNKRSATTFSQNALINFEALEKISWASFVDTNPPRIFSHIRTTQASISSTAPPTPSSPVAAANAATVMSL